MQEKILKLLKTKFEGVEDAILLRVATKLAETVKTDEEVQTAVDAVTLQRVIESYGDSRATEASHSAVANYEKKFKIKNGEKVEEGGAPADNGKAATTTEKPDAQQDDAPAWAKAIINRIEQLESGTKVQKEQSRMQQLAEAVAKLPETLQKPYKRIDVKSLSDEDFQTLLADVKTDATTLETQLSAKGAVFGIPREKGSGNKGDEIPASIKAAIEGPSSADGQPF
jgi:hypothetical protein